MGIHKTWWGEAFVESLTSFIDRGRLSRGRAYRSDHRVLSFDMQENQVKATIRGNTNPYFGVYKEPKYKVTLTFKKISKVQWNSVVDKICGHPGWLSKLMLNEIPSDIDNAFEEGGLLPKSYNDVTAECSCPDYENPCKHIAGVYYRIANMLDSQPMLLFPLHGISINDLQEQLKSNDLGKAFAEHLSSPQDIAVEIQKSKFTPILEKTITKTDSYWSMPAFEYEKKEEFEPITASIIKKQGDYPSFWERQNSFVKAMEDIYGCVRNKNKKFL
jgi:uncharacterized Zn finger protein